MSLFFSLVSPSPVQRTRTREEERDEHLARRRNRRSEENTNDTRNQATVGSGGDGGVVPTHEFLLEAEQNEHGDHNRCVFISIHSQVRSFFDSRSLSLVLLSCNLALSDDED